jgi:hypothetical protein
VGNANADSAASVGLGASVPTGLGTNAGAVEANPLGETGKPANVPIPSAVANVKNTEAGTNQAQAAPVKATQTVASDAAGATDVPGTGSTTVQANGLNFTHTVNKSGNVTVYGDPAEVRKAFPEATGATKFEDGKPAGVMFSVPTSPAVIAKLNQPTESSNGTKTAQAVQTESNPPQETRSARQIAIDSEIERVAAKKAESQARRAEAAKPIEGLSVGATPNAADPVTVKSGIVHIGKYPAQNYDTGEDVTVPEGASLEQVAKALKDAGALSNKTKIFGLNPVKDKITTPVAQRDLPPKPVDLGHVGKDNIPFVDGGKPFKTKVEATKAKKQQPMLRVIKVDGGFALAPKSEAQIKAHEAAGRRLQNSTGNAGMPMSAHEFVAREGGLSKDLRTNLGIEGNPRIGAKRLYAGTGGLTIEQASEKLKKAGYLSSDATHSKAFDLIRKSLTTPQYTAEGTERMAQAEQATRFEDHLAQQQEAAQDENYDPFQSLGELGYEIEDALSAGRTDLTEALQNEVDALLLQAEDAGIDIDLIRADAATETTQGSQDDYLNATKQKLQSAISGRTSSDNGTSIAQDGSEGRGQAAVAEGNRSSGQNDDSQAQSGKEVDLLGEAPNASQQAAENLRQKQKEKEQSQRDKAPTADGFELGMVDQKTGDEVAFGQQELSANRSPDAFVKAPDGSIDYGEITADVASIIGRQAGKIRLQSGVQNADGTGNGLVHIEARHGKQIRDLGYSDIPSFVADAVRDFDQIWKPEETSQIVAIVSDKKGRAIYLQLTPAKDEAGDFYRVNSAFPVGQGYAQNKEAKDGWKPLWSRYPVPANASGASGFVGQSPKAGETAPMVKPQGGNASVAQPIPESKPASEMSASELLRAAADKMDAKDKAATGETEDEKTYLAMSGLRKMAHEAENEGDIALGNGKFVTQEQAIAAAKEFMTEREHGMPFQFNRVLDIAPISWTRMVELMKPSKDGNQTKETDGGIAMFSRKSSVFGESRHEDLTATVSRINSKLTDANVHVVPTFTDLPQDIQDASNNAGLLPAEFRGVTVAKGQVYVVQGNHSNTQDVLSTIVHELYGHVGLRKLFGDKIYTSLNKLYLALGDKKVKEIADKYGVTDNGYFEMAQDASQAINSSKAQQAGGRTEFRNAYITEELLSHIAENETGTIKQRALEVIGAIRNWLRENGFANLSNLGMSDIAHILKQGRLAAHLANGDTSVAMPMFAKGEQTDTPAFRKWYGYWQNTGNETQGNKGNDRGVAQDSAGGTTVDGGRSGPVDSEGRPLRLYHGTNADITEFKVGHKDSWDHGWLGRGIYLTDSAELADSYANLKGGYENQTIMPLYAAIKNPYQATLETKKRLKNGGKEASEKFTKKLKDAGYDGVVLEYPDGVKEYVALNSGQVKSATGNNGEFDPENPDIRFSRTKMVGTSSRQHTPEQLKALKNIGQQIEVPTLKERFESLTKDLGKKMVQGVVDQFAPLKELGGDAYTLTRLAKGASGAFETILQGGKLKLTNGVYDFDEKQKGGLLEKLMMPLQGEHHDFLRWVAANRAEGLMTEGRENLFTPEDIKALKTLADGKTDFDYTIQNGVNAGQVTRDRTKIYADALATFNGFQKNVMDMYEQSGGVDPDVRKAFEREFYLPFYRVTEDDGELRGGSMKSGIVRQDAIKALKGGKDKLNFDLLDNTLMNWAHLLDAAAKNRAAKSALDTMATLGKAVEAPEETARQMAKSIGKKDAVVWYMDSGKKRFFIVDDPYLLTAVTALDYAGIKGPIMTR